MKPPRITLDLHSYPVNRPEDLKRFLDWMLYKPIDDLYAAHAYELSARLQTNPAKLSLKLSEAIALKILSEHVKTGAYAYWLSEHLEDSITKALIKHRKQATGCPL